MRKIMRELEEVGEPDYIQLRPLAQAAEDLKTKAWLGNY
jgi:hypothetical protein